MFPIGSDLVNVCAYWKLGKVVEQKEVYKGVPFLVGFCVI